MLSNRDHLPSDARPSALRSVVGIAVLCVALSQIDSVQAQNPPAPPGNPPEVCRAIAYEKDGAVLIRIERPEYLLPRRATFPEERVWKPLRPATFDRSVHAYRSDGQRLTREETQKALENPTPIFMFLRTSERYMTPPDPYYLALFRKDTVVLVVEAAAVLPLAP